MKAKFESSYDENFPEESAAYYGLLLKYAKLSDVDGNTACRIAIEALIYADRYNTIANDAAKLENIKATKGDMQKFFYGRYRTLHLMHEHCVSISNNAYFQARNYGKGT
ncbi:MAG: hypothetical protein PHQ35_09590 [Phycisphaerae bacterium]|nr:hypothetical protein [Phycisphaerae bacterium]MDD5239968.1 hypothetical protein [Candidatus Nanoarchaeia archaeon]